MTEKITLAGLRETDKELSLALDALLSIELSVEIAKPLRDAVEAIEVARDDITQMSIGLMAERLSEYGLDVV